MIDISNFKAWQVHAGLEVELIELDDCKSWAANQLSQDVTDQSRFFLREVLSACDSDQLSRLMFQLSDLSGEQLEKSCRQAEAVVRELWKARLEEYLKGGMQPNDLCKSVFLIENQFDFPDWLGDMYHACDYVDENYRRDNAIEVEREARRLLEEDVAGGLNTTS